MTQPARERTEELERASLSSWATLSGESKGREVHEEPDRTRTAFQVDVDRIVASTAFRRLPDKTASHLAPGGEAYPSLLDRTLAAARTARTLARALRLNEDLTEAIALGRELGASGFAGVGEEALSAFTEAPFRHNEQSVRVVERLERDGEGLNLTWEVRDGILTHTAEAPTPATLEGQVVRLAARITSAVGDLADAVATGVVVVTDVPADIRAALGERPATMERALVEDAVAVSDTSPEVRLSPMAEQALGALEAFLTARVHERHGVLEERARGIHCLRSLLVFYLDNPRRLPAVHRRGDEPVEVRCLDFVSGLSDGQALRLFTRLFLPRASPHRP